MARTEDLGDLERDRRRPPRGRLPRQCRLRRRVHSDRHGHRRRGPVTRRSARHPGVNCAAGQSALIDVVAPEGGITTNLRLAADPVIYAVAIQNAV